MDKRIIVYQNLAELLDSGVPILRALKTSASGVRGGWSFALKKIVDLISGGASLSEAMTQYPRLFKPIDRMVIETGEMSGNLPKALNLLSDWYRLTSAMTYRMMSGMILPGLVLHFAAVLIPFIYEIRKGIDNFSVDAYLINVLLILVIFFWGPILVISAIIRLTPPLGILRRILDSFVLAIPGLGGGMRYMAMSRYCRAFHLFISAGVNGVEAARRSCNVTGNAKIATWFKGAADSAKAGNPFSEGLSKRLPLMFREQWVVGEETGRLDLTTKRLADSNQETGERKLINFSRWFPRLVYFIMVLVMAYFVVTLMVGHYTNILDSFGV